MTWFKLDPNTLEAPGLIVNSGGTVIRHHSTELHQRMGRITFLQLAPGASEVFWLYAASLYRGVEVELDEANVEFFKAEWMRSKAVSSKLVWFIDKAELTMFSQFKPGSVLTFFATG